MQSFKYFKICIIMIFIIVKSYCYFVTNHYNKISSFYNKKLFLIYNVDKDKSFLNSLVALPDLPEISAFDDNSAKKIISNNQEKEYENKLEGEKLQIGLQYFREYSRKGIESFQQGKLEDAILYLNKAIEANTTQPLQQRGIILYCVGDFKNAEKQLCEDIKKIEKMKIAKATELRIWHSACLNKLSRYEDAKEALDLNYIINIPVITQSYLLNSTLSFFNNSKSLDDMLEIIGDPNERDLTGTSFFGNLYLGLFYDSMNEVDLAQTFLSIPNESNRYPSHDMWYHIPRVLYNNRFPNSINNDLTDDSKEILIN